MKRILNQVKNIRWYFWVVLLILIGIGYLHVLRFQGLGWVDWTGFEGKTLWDVVELLIIPVSIAIIATLLDLSERKIDRNNTLDNQREIILQSYLDMMTRLILEKGLLNSKNTDVVQIIARSKTLSSLARLDGKRKGTIVDFLSDAGCLRNDDHKKQVVDLNGADLSEVQIFFTRLCKLWLNGTNLEKSDLRASDLAEATLQQVNLKNASMVGVNLTGSSVAGVDMSHADLSKSYWENASMYSCDFSGARLEGATLYNAKILGCCLRNASFVNASLKDAILNCSIIDNTNFEGALMPDGNIYDPGIHTIEYLNGLTQNRVSE